MKGLISKEETEKAAEKPPKILVLGAELVCPCGSSHSYLDLDTEHVSIAGLPQANVTDCKVLDNILPFGTCRQSRGSHYNRLYHHMLCEWEGDICGNIRSEKEKQIC